MLRNFVKEFGIDLSNDKVPYTNNVPRVFLMDENRVTTLEDRKIKPGTREFWEVMQQNRMFVYPAGETEPVQLHVEGKYPPKMVYSDPLNTSGKDFKYEGAAPKKDPMPKEVARPGWFSRLMNRINSNWFKEENDAYKAYSKKCKEITEKFEKATKEYQDAAKEAEEGSKIGPAASDLAKQTFGTLRKNEIGLNAEKIEKVDLLRQLDEKDLLQTRIKNAENAKANVNLTERSVGYMMSMYAPQPKPADRLIAVDCYKKEELDKLTKIELPQDITIGSVKVDDRLFSNLALHAQMNPEISRPFVDDLSPSKNVCTLAEQDGMSKERVDKMAALMGSAQYVSDALASSPRPRFAQFFNAATDKGRKEAERALLEYKNGNREPLAQIIYNAAVVTTISAKQGTCANGALTNAKMSCELLDLLDQDKDLAEAAKKKGLTEKEIKTCRSMNLVRELSENSLAAEAKIAEAAADPNVHLNDQEKLQCMKDIVKFRTVEAMVREQANPKYFDEFQKVEQEKTNRVKAGMQPEDKRNGVKPLDQILSHFSTELYRYELIDSPAILDKLSDYRAEEKANELAGKEKKPSPLDKLVEKTVLAMGYGKMDVKTLADHHIGSKALRDDKLLRKQSEIQNANVKAPDAAEKQSEVQNVNANPAVEGKKAEKAPDAAEKQGDEPEP